MTKRKPLRFTELELLEVLDEAQGSLVKAAKLLTAYGRGTVTVQLLRAWVSRSDHAELGQAYDRAKSLATTRNAQAENSKLRRDNRALIQAVGTKEMFEDAVGQMLIDFPERGPVDYKSYLGNQAGTRMTVEILLSDLQIGKLSKTYNTEVAKKRLFEFGRMARFQIEQKISAGYRIEGIFLGLLGDIIESDKKHENSAKATDSTTAEQIYDAVSSIFE